MRLQFLGANNQVTGSRYLLEAGGLRLQVDCGMFQERKYRGLNWEPSRVPPGDIDFLLLTHSHVDHVGLVPRLVKNGYDQPIYATRASAEIARIVLLDAAHIQEEDAEFKRRRHQREGRKGKHPELPLYTRADVERSLPLFRGVGYDEPVALSDEVSVRFTDAGHILGSASVEVTARENGATRRIVFSGDIGQWDKALVRDPTPPAQADYIVMESTYGDSLHTDPGDPEEMLCQVINETVDAGGNVIIPTFAIERAQELMYHLGRLQMEDRIPHLLTFVDSPMAVNVTDVFSDHLECLDEETHELLRSHHDPFNYPGLTLVRTVEESKAINRIKGSCVIMAGSGMCTGGRIKHHLIRHLPRHESTVLFVGYQAVSTLGRQIVDGADEVRIHGETHPVRARIAQIHGFSAHADQQDLERWVGSLEAAPRRVFVTHGEEKVSDLFADKLSSDKGWDTVVPGYTEAFELD